MTYINERKYDLSERMAVAVIFAVIWSIIGTGPSGVFSEILMCMILVFSAEFSYEYYQGNLHIRSAGQRWILTGIVKWIIWPIMWPLDTFFKVRNFPAMAALMTGLYIMGWLAGMDFLDQLVHVILLWYLYHMRKVNK